MDGFGAACAHYMSTKLKNVTYKGVSYGFLKNLNNVDEFPWKDDSITHIMFLDICPTREVLDFLTNVMGFKVTILDHHETAKQILMGYSNPLVCWVIADNFSGATLALSCATVIDVMLNYNPTNITTVNTVNGTITSNIDADSFVYRRHLTSEYHIFQLLEVRDLWIKDNPKLKADADAIASYFKFHELAKLEPQNIIELVEKLGGVDKLIADGNAIQEVQTTMVSDAIDHSYKSDIVLSNNKVVKLCIGIGPSDLGSMFGDMWNTQNPEGSLAIALFFNPRANEIGVSARSNNGLARRVCTALGGGGHDNAAGCVIRPRTKVGDLPSINAIVRRIENILMDLKYFN